MPSDPRQLRPSELCRLINSTPVGEVITEKQLHTQRNRAGLRIGTNKHVDLFRYIAWLVLSRHVPKSVAPADGAYVDLAAVAEGAASLETDPGHGEKINSKQEALIAALLTEANHADAAVKAGVGRATVSRWLQKKSFRLAYRRARRAIVDNTIGRIQTSTSQALDTLLSVSRNGRRDSDRVRAAMALMDYAFRGLQQGEVLDHDTSTQEPVTTTDIVAILGQRLKQLDHAELSTSERSRLTANLADALLKAISVGVLDQRLEAIQSVLLTRKKNKS